MLSPALYNYELDRVTGLTFGNQEFQSCIKNYVPEGHTFKGYPSQFTHTNADQIIQTFRNSAIATDILNTAGDEVRFALKLQVEL